MSKKKSRRHRGPRTQPPVAQGGGANAENTKTEKPAVTARPAAAMAPKAAIARATVHSSHNLGLELRMIAILGGGAIAILALLSMVQPTAHVASWLRL